MKGRICSHIIAALCLVVPVAGWTSTKEGVRLYAAHKFDKAMKVLTPEAEKGDATAQFYLAFLKVGGMNHTWNDYAEGTKWLKASAKGGNPYAMWQLGTSAYCGFRLSCGNQQAWKAKAINRWKQLAKQGDGDAVAMLAENNAGVVQFIPWLGDYVYKKQMKKAAEMGSGYAANAYYNAFDYMKIHKQEKKLSMSLLLNAARKGSVLAMGTLSNGDFDVMLGKKQSFLWAEKCAELGYTECVGSMYFDFLEGVGVKQDLQQAYKWGLISKQFNIIGVTSDMELEKGKVLLSHLTSAQKTEAKKEADAFVATHLPNYGANPMNP